MGLVRSAVLSRLDDLENARTAFAEAQAAPPFVPRWYQEPVWAAWRDGVRHLLMCWGRRCGKDETALRVLRDEMQRRPGTYWYMAVTQKQAREVMWDAIDETVGTRRLDLIFPAHVRAGRANNSRMTLPIRSAEGKVSVLHVLGADNYETAKGSPPVGIVWSEFADVDPDARGNLALILVKNRGLEIFASTSSGRNHYADLIDLKRDDPEWHVSIVDSVAAGVFTEAQIEDLIAQGMDRNLALQQFYCSLDTPVVGAVYGDEIVSLIADGRLTDVPYDPALAVYTGWDLGKARASGEPGTACWFVQFSGERPRIIDFMEWSGKGAIDILPEFAEHRRASGYSTAEDVFPHDLRSATWGEELSREQICRNNGVIPTISSTVPISEAGYVADGIEAVRRLLRMAIIDRTKCKVGLRHLQDYAWEDRRIGTTKHDAASHAADALRVLAMHRRRSAAPMKVVNRWGGLRGQA